LPWNVFESLSWPYDELLLPEPYESDDESWPYDDDLFPEP